MAFDLRKIPSVMTKKGWTEGATLLESWFTRAVAINPNFGPPDTTTISMKWVTSFPRANTMYQQLLNDKAWRTKLSWMRNDPINLVRTKVSAITVSGDKPSPFGDLTKPVPDIHSTWQITYGTVGGQTDTLDGMKAALGRFNLYVAIAGEVAAVPKSTKRKVTVKSVGIYVGDTFDFNDGGALISQPLGYWDTDKGEVGNTPFAGATYVNNASFNDWRTKNGMGGDFRIFSNISVETLTPADTFEV